MDYKVGDFVILSDYTGIKCIKLVTKIESGYAKTIDLTDESLGNENFPSNGTDIDGYIKINTNQQLIQKAYERLLLASQKNFIDNLTYVEICARIKEQEESLNNENS